MLNGNQRKIEALREELMKARRLVVEGGRNDVAGFGREKDRREARMVRSEGCAEAGSGCDDHAAHAGSPTIPKYERRRTCLKSGRREDAFRKNFQVIRQSHRCAEPLRNRIGVDGPGAVRERRNPPGNRRRHSDRRGSKRLCVGRFLRQKRRQGRIKRRDLVIGNLGPTPERSAFGKERKARVRSTHIGREKHVAPLLRLRPAAEPIRDQAT
jgi:hypothetical protein